MHVKLKATHYRNYLFKNETCSCYNERKKLSVSAQSRRRGKCVTAGNE